MDIIISSLLKSVNTNCSYPLPLVAIERDSREAGTWTVPSCLCQRSVRTCGRIIAILTFIIIITIATTLCSQSPSSSSSLTSRAPTWAAPAWTSSPPRHCQGGRLPRTAGTWRCRGPPGAASGASTSGGSTGGPRTSQTGWRTCSREGERHCSSCRPRYPSPCLHQRRRHHYLRHHRHQCRHRRHHHLKWTHILCLTSIFIFCFGVRSPCLITATTHLSSILVGRKSLVSQHVDINKSSININGTAHAYQLATT